MILNNFIRQRSRNYVIVVCICLLIILTVLGGCTSSRNEKAEKVRRGMTAYLQDRYGIEFEVGKPYLTGSMSTTHYQAKAHPKEKSEIEFIINDDSYMDEMGSGVYADYYLTAKWSYQGRLEVEKKLKEVYGEGADINISRYEFHGRYDFKDLDYAQLFEKGHGLIKLHYHVFMNTQFNKEEEAKKAYQILKPLVLDFGSDVSSFSVTYIEKSFKKEYLEYPGRSLAFYEERGYVGKKILNFLQVDYRAKPTEINSDNDLVKFFKY